MILLFEEYHYPKQLLKELLGDYVHLHTELKNGKAKVQYVGYFFSKEKGNSVFILPKVFIDEQHKAFGKYLPEDITNINAVDGYLGTATGVEGRIILYGTVGGLLDPKCGENSFQLTFE